MTIEQLNMLKLVAEQGSLKKASELLYKTQPAISQGIKQLEHQLGLQLFNRQGYRLALSSEGQQIYNHTLRLLNEAAEIKQLSKHLSSGHEASITIAIEAAYDLNKIIPILEKTQNRFPLTQIVIKQEYISGAFEAIKQEQADIAITPVGMIDLEAENLERYFLYQGFLINVAAPKLLLRHPQLTSIKDLQNEYQIVVQDSGQRSKGKNYSVQSGQRCWYVNDFNTKKTLILSGMGWGRLPDNQIDNELDQGSLQAITLTDFEQAAELNYYALKLKSKLLGPVAQTLWDDLKNSKHSD